MIESELRDRGRRLDATADDNEFLVRWHETLGWLTTMTASCDRLFDDATGEPYRAFLAAHQRRYLTLSELEVADRLDTLDVSGPQALAALLECPFARKAYDRVAEALDMVDLAGCRELVDVGSGPFPAAALLLHEHTDVPCVVAVDNDATAVERGQRVAQRLAGPRLEVRTAEGSTYDYAGAGVVYVANHVVGKAAVLARIAATAPLHVQVLVREPCGPGRLLAEAACDALPSALRVVRHGADDHTFHSRHVLLARRA